MMTILKKIKLALLASAVVLSPQGMYAVGSDSDDSEKRGCMPQATPREALFEGEEGVASSSQVVDLAIQTTIFIPRIPQETLVDISARIPPNGAILEILETRNLGKTVETPQTSPQSPQSPRKKGKPNGEMGAEEQISLPSTTIKMETPQRFEESLPAIFLKFSERYIILRQEITEEEELETFNDLYRSFIDVLQRYKNYYPEFNPYFGIVSKDPQEDPKRYQSFMALAKIYQSYYPDFSTEKPAF